MRKNLKKIKSNLIAEEFINKFYYFKNVNFKDNEIAENNYHTFKCQFYNYEICKTYLNIFKNLDFIYTINNNIHIFRIIALGRFNKSDTYFASGYRIPCKYSVTSLDKVYMHYTSTTDFYDFCDHLLNNTEIISRKPLTKKYWKELTIEFL